MTSPGRALAPESVRPGESAPIPEVEMKSRSALPRGTTLVSPVSTRTSASAAAVAMEATTRSRSARGRPSSRMKEALSASGRAPAVARSFTVPQTASLPISPPGKKIGSTTKASVVNANSPGVRSRAASSPGGSPGPKCARKTRSISSAMRWPPSP